MSGPLLTGAWYIAFIGPLQTTISISEHRVERLVEFLRDQQWLLRTHREACARRARAAMGGSGSGAGAGAGAGAGSGGDDDGDESKEDEVLPVLSNVSFEASPGDLVAVVGPVGSGKSSLAAGMLGELFIAKGEVSVSGSIAYVAQTSWIQHLSLQGRLARARLAPSSPVITSGAVLLHRQHPVRQTHGPQSLQGRAPHVPA